MAQREKRSISLPPDLARAVDDAARAMILAAERGRIGERYLISERMIALSEVVRLAADEAGVPPPPR